MPESNSQLDILIKIQSDLDGLKKAQQGLAQSKQEAQGLGQVGTAMFGKLGLGSLTFAGGMVAAAGAIAMAAKAGLEHCAVIEQQTAKFEMLLGSADAATKRVKELSDFANSSGFEFAGVARANRLLETLTAGALSGTDGMKLIGDAAAYADRPIDEVASTVGRLYNALKNGTPVTLVTNQLAQMGVISGETKRQLDGLERQGITGAQAWQVAEDALGKYSGAMERQTHTFTGLMGVAKSALVEFAATSAKPIFSLFRDGLEVVLTKLGVLPTELEKSIKAIEAGAPRIRKAVSNMTGETKEKTHADVRGELSTAQAAREKEANKYLYTPSQLLGKEKYDEQAKALAAYDQKIRELQIDLAKFDGIKTENVGMDAAQVAARIAELEKLSHASQWVTVDNPLGPKTEELQSRGFKGGEQAEYNYLKNLQAAAGTADQIARANDAQNAQAAAAREAATEVERINASAGDFASSLEKSNSALAWAKATDEERLGLLDQMSDRADEDYQAKMQLAASAASEDDRKAISDRAAAERAMAYNAIETQRMQVQAGIAAETKRAADAQKKADDEAARAQKKTQDDALKAIAIREKTELDAIRRQIDLANQNPDLTRAQRQQIINALLAREKEKLDEIIARLRTLRENADPSNQAEVAQIDAEISAYTAESENAGAGTPKKQRAITQRVSNYKEASDNSQLTATEGMVAGLIDATTQLNGAGENIAQLFSGAIMDSVNAISDGIYGWITGTESFRDVLINLGDQIFKEMLNTIVRIGVQWLLNTILVKTGIISIGATQDAQRAGQTTKTVAANATVAASAAPGAMAAGISSWGVALIFGALALAMILAAASAFEMGGPIHGREQFIRVNENGPEYVMNAAARAKYGDAMLAQINAGTFDFGMRNADFGMTDASGGLGNSAFRNPHSAISEALATAPIASTTTPAAALAQAAGNAPASSAQSAAQSLADAMPEQQPPRVNIAQFSTRNDARDWLQSQEGHKHLIDTTADNRAEMGIST